MYSSSINLKSPNAIWDNPDDITMTSSGLFFSAPSRFTDHIINLFLQAQAWQLKNVFICVINVRTGPLILLSIHYSGLLLRTCSPVSPIDDERRAHNVLRCETLNVNRNLVCWAPSKTNLKELVKKCFKSPAVVEQSKRTLPLNPSFKF